MHIGIGRTIGSFAEGGIRWVAVASSRQTNSFVMGGSNARGPGGMRATASKCWHFAVPNITAPSIRSLSVISNDYGKRKIHRMLPLGWMEAAEQEDPLDESEESTIDETIVSSCAW